MQLFDFSPVREINYKNEILAGLTVAIALVPEAIAFAFIAGVPPLVGLYAACIMGLTTAILGGRPGMISGATGAIAIVLVPLIQEHGIDYLFPAVIIGGLIQIGVGLLKLGKFIRLIPHSVMLGFVNGLAIVIFLAQFSQFKVVNTSGETEWLSGNALYIMIGLVLLTMAIIHFLPKFTKVIPSALAGIIVISAIAIGFDLNTSTVGDMASISGGLPSLIIPDIPYNFHSFMILLPFALKIAAVGLIESLLTLTLIDEITETRGRGNRECVAQGLGNVLSGFLGGMGGCAMIGQSMINISSNARYRLSGIVAGGALLTFILFFGAIIEQIPIAALVGVMFMVAIGTFEWSSIRVLNKVPRVDMVIIIIVSLITVIEDLAIAVLIGTVLAALAFAWDNALRIRARKSVDENGVKFYEIYGPLFFGSSKTFLDKFSVKNDPDKVIIDFAESRIADQSGLEAIRKIDEKYRKAGKSVAFRHLSKDCQQLLATAQLNIEIDPYTDPEYQVVYDKE